MDNPKEFIREKLIGDITYITPKPPAKTNIDNYNLTEKNQRFYAPDKDVVYRISSKMNNGDDLTPKEVAFVLEENRRIREGYWFYNNGNLEYITGFNYFYLSAWKIVRMQDTVMPNGEIKRKKFSGLPDFTDADRDFFYAWQAVLESGKCVGMIYASFRRSGKTYKSSSIIYLITILNQDAITSIQSKTNRDAKEVFKKVVKSWQTLPTYYKPTDSGDSNPASVLRFAEPAKRTSKTQKKEYSEVLNSEISYYPSNEEQLDGMYLTLSFIDEGGKMSGTNIAELFRVNRECTADGTEISGKILMPTTVEEMERKGGKNFKELWDSSDLTKLNDVGFTATGLWRLFIPASKGLRGTDENDIPFIDEYGYSDEKRTREYLQKKRKGLTGAALSSERRKYPLIVQDCFVMDGSEEIFNNEKLEQQKWYNETLTGMVRTGNFYWDNNEKTKVSFNDNPNGRFKVSWMPEESQRNRITQTRNGYSPLNGDKLGGGADNYDHHLKKDGRRLSDAAFYIFRGYDHEYPIQSNTWVCEYVNRPENPDDCYEDVLMAAVFYGCPVLMENQKPGMINYFNREGYGGFVKKTRKTDYTQSTSRTWEDGISTAGNLMRNEMINKLKRHIIKFVGKISEEVQREDLGYSTYTEDLMGSLYFDALLDDLASFEANNWTDYDSTVGAGLAYLCLNPVERKKRNTDDNGGNIDMPFSTFSI